MPYIRLTERETHFRLTALHDQIGKQASKQKQKALAGYHNLELVAMVRGKFIPVEGATEHAQLVSDPRKHFRVSHDDAEIGDQFWVTSLSFRDGNSETPLAVNQSGNIGEDGFRQIFDGIAGKYSPSLHRCVPLSVVSFLVEHEISLARIHPNCFHVHQLPDGEVPRGLLI